MGKNYFNVMETLVENEFEMIKGTLDCCLCEDCASDILALTLNQFPPKYVVSHKGKLYTKLASESAQFRSDIWAALLKAANIVKQSPRH